MDRGRPHIVNIYDLDAGEDIAGAWDNTSSDAPVKPKNLSPKEANNIFQQLEPIHFCPRNVSAEACQAGSSSGGTLRIQLQRALDKYISSENMYQSRCGR